MSTQLAPVKVTESAVRQAFARAWGWLEEQPLRGLGVACVFTVVMRLPFMAAPVTADEGGFSMVAGQWHGGGSSLYGDQWVDRPPVLFLVFKLAGWIGGDEVGLRLLSLGLGLLTVAAAWWAGRIINGVRGATVGALAGSVVSSTVVLDGYTLSGEGVAGAFVMASCALALEAKYGKRPDRASVLLAALAGVFAASAALTKQNFIDAAVFALVLLGISVQRTWRLLLACAAGFLFPVSAAVVWATGPGGPGLAKVWYALFGFRQRAYELIQSPTSSLARLEQMLGLLGVVLVTGIVLLAWQLVAGAANGRRRRSLRLAVIVMFAYGLVSISLSASWWRHYLLELAPVLALGTALASRRTVRLMQTRLSVVAVAVSAAVSTVVGVQMQSAHTLSSYEDQVVADWLKTAASPTDSVVLSYGSANIIEMSGLTTPYRYSWGLPVRARDPHLKTLVRTLRGPYAPIWLVEIGNFDWWGLDTHAFERVRRNRYEQVATVCGHAVYLLAGIPRSLPAVPQCD